MRVRKFKKTRAAHRVFLVICEGETEENYVNALKQFFRLPITIKTKVSGNAISRRLVENYVQELGIADKSDYEIFYIYDSDVDVVVDKLLKLPEGTLILSNPCIELWYLLHMKDHNRFRDSKAIVKDLINSHNAWRNYCKGTLSVEQRNILLNNHEVASMRSKRLNWHENPSTNMYAFLEALKAENR
ncbi:MAG: RloB family protein [Muribaculum sp.]|nr:RloB family protein [Muribaculum sp.]